jgi:hypothetical protein
MLIKKSPFYYSILSSACVLLQMAKRVVHAHEPHYVHSSEVARRKRFNPRVLGRITGNVWFTVSWKIG